MPLSTHRQAHSTPPLPLFSLLFSSLLFYGTLSITLTHTITHKRAICCEMRKLKVDFLCTTSKLVDVSSISKVICVQATLIPHMQTALALEWHAVSVRRCWLLSAASHSSLVHKGGERKERDATASSMQQGFQHTVTHTCREECKRNSHLVWQ